MKYLFSFILVAACFCNLHSQDLSGVWFDRPNLGRFYTTVETSWGEEKVDDGCMIFDFETDDWYKSGLSSYDHVPILSITKEGNNDYILKVDPEYFNNFTAFRDPSEFEDTYRITVFSGDRIQVNRYNEEKRESVFGLSGYSEYYYRISGPSKISVEYSATHRTLENLSLRRTAATTSKLVTTLPKDTEVQFVETGSATTIDSVNATWVKVVSSNGYTGWCLSEYLEKIPKPESVVSTNTDKSNAENNNEEHIQNNADASFIPLWAWFAIIGGTVVIAGGVVFVLMRSRK